MGLRRVEGVESDELPGDETVVLQPSTGFALFLNAMGGVVWDLCDGSRGAAQIADFICEHVAGADPERVRVEVAAVTSQLLEHKLIEDSETCGPRSSMP